MTSLPTRIRMCPYILAVAGALLHIGPQAPAALISINNTSSSLYEIRDESAGNATVVPQNTNQREATQTYALTDAHNYRLHLGQVGDQGSHFFKVDGSGNLAFDPLNEPTPFFLASDSTTLRIGSIPISLRLLSGPAGTTVSAGSDAYFAPPELQRPRGHPRRAPGAR